MPDSQEKGVACLLDTDIVIDFLRRRDYARTLIKKWAGEGLLAISALTYLEIYQGIKSGEEEATKAFLDGLTTIDVGIQIARQAGQMLAGLRSKGVTVGLTDSVIAATALQLNVPLLTNNVVHYPFPDLKVVKGSQS